MDTIQLTEEIMELSKKTASHDQQIKTLFHQQAEIKKLTDATHELALSVKDLTNNIMNVDERVRCIEDEKRKKSFAVWQIVAGALIGGAIGYFIFG
jgi:predicted  nucleic acid-binding Zn-ribbon protein